MPRPRGDATAPFQLRLRPATKTALEAAAARNHRSTNTEIGVRLERSLEGEREHGDEDVGRLLRALGQVMTTAGEDAGELAGKPWLSDPWSYGQVCTAVEALLGALRPAGAVEPPAIEPGPELVKLIEQLGSEDRARSYLEATRDRIGIAVVEYLLGRGRGSFYRGTADFQERLGPELAGRNEANWPTARSRHRHR
jgi:hypothetical protein